MPEIQRVFHADTVCHTVTLTFDPMTMKVRGTSSVVIKVCTKLERNRAILDWIIDSFAHGYGTSHVMRLNCVQKLSEIE